MSAIGTLLKVLQLPDRSGFRGIAAGDRRAPAHWCCWICSDRLLERPRLSRGRLRTRYPAVFQSV
jgi:hypothetical protein